MAPAQERRFEANSRGWGRRSLDESKIENPVLRNDHLLHTLAGAEWWLVHRRERGPGAAIIWDTGRHRRKNRGRDPTMTSFFTIF